MSAAPFQPNSEWNMNARSVIVIGSGIAGLGAAAHLAQRGLHVTVLEKNDRPGGRLNRFSRGGHHCDTGPTLLVMPLLYEAEFAALGVSLRDALDLRRVDPTYHLVFDDGNELALPSDPDAMRHMGDFFNAGNLPLLFQVRPLVPHYRHMRAYFDDPRLKAAFTFQDVYMGLSPFEAPATFSMMPYTEDRKST